VVTAKHIGESPVLSLQQAMPDHIKQLLTAS